MKRTAGLRTLVVLASARESSSLAAAIERAGHETIVAPSLDRASMGPNVDVVVLDLDACVANSPDPFETLRAWRDRGNRPAIVLTGTNLEPDSFRRALLIGAVDFLPKPLRAEDVVRALASSSRASALHGVDADRGVWDRTYTSTPAAVAQAIRDVIAFALRCGIGPATRARIGGALGEVFENARRHGYAHGRGPIHVRALLDEQVMRVSVTDEGHGCERDEARLAARTSCRSSGLARALSLCEDIAFESTPDRGTCVQLTFQASRVEFDEASVLDLADTDFLDPDLARRVLHALARPETSDMFRFPPALAVVVGRLLAGPDPCAGPLKAQRS